MSRKVQPRLTVLGRPGVWGTTRGTTLPVKRHQAVTSCNANLFELQTFRDR